MLVELLRSASTINDPSHRGRQVDTRVNLPLLSIDDLTASRANRGFVSSLYARAHSMKISVLILTKDEDWATTMKNING